MVVTRPLYSFHSTAAKVAANTSRTPYAVPPTASSASRARSSILGMSIVCLHTSGSMLPTHRGESLRRDYRGGRRRQGIVMERERIGGVVVYGYFRGIIPVQGIGCMSTDLRGGRSQFLPVCIGCSITEGLQGGIVTLGSLPFNISARYFWTAGRLAGVSARLSFPSESPPIHLARPCTRSRRDPESGDGLAPCDVEAASKQAFNQRDLPFGATLQGSAVRFEVR